MDVWDSYEPVNRWKVVWGFVAAGVVMLAAVAVLWVLK